ncbi:MAG: asparaginase [Actinobacteria bacterium 69-20]|nr:asparaginase [Actinomycetota bacterium]OJV23514.1 MAG: asparaginase [Actinobacteria bacterium 69-20]
MNSGDYALLATVVRNGFEESRHFGSLVALGPDGSVVAELGVPRQAILPRSSVKPIQALGSLECGAPLAGTYLAIAGGSHTGEDEHVRVVREILAAAGLAEDALQCPPDEPENAETKRRLIREGVAPQRIRMNCSGKHAGMLAACVASGWPTETYRDPEHPLQQRIRHSLEERAGEKVAAVAVDGCGAPLFGVSLVGLARAVRSLVVEAPGAAGRTVADAMRENPYYVGGTGHVNTRVMQGMPGVLCKGGAEGVIVAAAASGCAVAVKAIDGSPRATTAIALAALEALGEDTSRVADLREVPVLGGGEPVGAIQASPAIGAAIAAAGFPRTA